MSLSERIFEEAKRLPESVQQQVLDFTLFLKAKERQQLSDDMDAVIAENLPALKELAK